MRILWICGGLLPDACKAIGFADGRINGGFMASAFTPLASGCDNQFCVLSWDARPCDVQIANVRHVSFFRGDANQRATQVINEFNPDIIHILGTEGVFAHLPLAVFGGRPVVISMQGVMAGCATNYSGALTHSEMRGTHWNLSYLRHGMTIWSEQDRWRTARARQEELTMRRHRYFIGRTDFDRAWVRYCNPAAQYYHVDENLRGVFYSVKRDSSRLRRHSVYCGGASGYPLKGCHWLLRAVAALRTTYPDISLRIANAADLVGRTSFLQRARQGFYTTYLRRLIRNLSLEDSIVALPALSATEVADELCSAEVFVLPSLCENSPNALGEAMLAGTPVVATYTGGIPSMVKNGLEGLLVPTADPALIADAIRKCFEDPESAAERAAAAKKVALQRHDVEKNTKELFRVYNAIVQEDAK